MRMKGRMKGLMLVLTATFAMAQAPKPTAVPYAWKNVQIVGGGFVDGLIFHPTATDVCYARTDMGSAYRWDAAASRWQPLLDWMPYEDLNLMGVESISVDPSDADRVYLACGTYTSSKVPDGAILRSRDQGRTFQRTNVPFKFGGNEDGRGNGERMAVDPNDGKILFLGTRKNGLWTSRDAAKTWVRINDDQHQLGLVLHISGDPKIHGRVYVGTHGRGILYGDPVKE